MMPLFNHDNTPSPAPGNHFVLKSETTAPPPPRVLPLYAPPPPQSRGQRHRQQHVSGTADPGVFKQDTSSRGSVDTTKTRSDPQRVRMSSGESPIGAAKGKQPNTEALCQPPPPQSPAIPDDPPLTGKGDLRAEAPNCVAHTLTYKRMLHSDAERFANAMATESGISPQHLNLLFQIRIDLPSAVPMASPLRC